MPDPGDEEQQQAIDVIYDLLVQRGSWPTFTVVDRRLDQTGLDAETILGAMPADVLRGDPRAQRWYRPDQEVSLSLSGVVRATGAQADLERLVAFIHWLADTERSHDPEATGAPLVVDALQALAAIGPSPDGSDAEGTARRLSVLMDLLPGIWSSRDAREDVPWWSITVARGIRRYRGITGSEDLVARTNAAWRVGSDTPAPLSIASGERPAAAPVESSGPDDDAYDVALSFASEEREYVEAVATRLIELHVTVFYDAFETVELWGRNLLDVFADVYGRRARYVVMFVSAAYAEKAWTNAERQEAQARALKSRRESVLPVRFDDTQIPALPGTVHYLNAQDYTPQALGGLIYEKLNRRAEHEPARPAATLQRAPAAAVGKGLGGAATGTTLLPAPPIGAPIADRETWAVRHREAALRGLSGLGKSDHYEVEAAVVPGLPMPSQRQLAESVAAKNIDTFGWPIGVYLASQQPRPLSEGIVAEVSWEERGTYDYWALSRDGRFYLLKTLSEDALLAPDKLYFNTRIVRVAETVMFLSALYVELGASRASEVTLKVVHSGLHNRTLAAVGPRKGSFRDRQTVESEVVTTTTFRLVDADTGLVSIVRALLDPVFMLYEYLELADEVYADIIERFRAGTVS